MVGAPITSHSQREGLSLQSGIISSLDFILPQLYYLEHNLYFLHVAYTCTYFTQQLT